MPFPRLAGVTSPRQRWFGPGRAGQDAVVTSEVDAGFGYQGSQTGNEIHRFEGHLCRAIPVRSFQRVDHLSRGAQ